MLRCLLGSRVARPALSRRVYFRFHPSFPPSAVAGGERGLEKSSRSAWHPPPPFRPSAQDAPPGPPRIAQTTLVFDAGSVADRDTLVACLRTALSVEPPPAGGSSDEHPSSGGGAGGAAPASAGDDESARRARTVARQLASAASIASQAVDGRRRAVGAVVSRKHLARSRFARLQASERASACVCCGSRRPPAVGDADGSPSRRPRRRARSMRLSFSMRCLCLSVRLPAGRAAPLVRGRRERQLGEHGRRPPPVEPPRDRKRRR